MLRNNTGAMIFKVQWAAQATTVQNHDQNVYLSVPADTTSGRFSDKHVAAGPVSILAIVQSTNTQHDFQDSYDVTITKLKSLLIGSGYRRCSQVPVLRTPVQRYCTGTSTSLYSGRSDPSTYPGVLFDRRIVRASHGLAGVVQSF